MNDLAPRVGGMYYRGQLTASRLFFFLLPLLLVTALAARLWGTWTGLASLIRLSFAYSPREPTLYTLTILSYVVAGGFYTYETFVTHTIKLDQWPTYAPFIVSSGSILWLLAMRSSILGGGSSGKAKRN